MNTEFRGTGVALVTPFKDGKVDFKSLKKLINHTIDGGLEFLVSLGTTGESATLSVEEKLKVLEFTADVNQGRVPLVAGFGGNDTKKVIETIQNFHFNGYDAILSVSPAYNKPTQEGIYRHFMAIEAIAPRPIILYNVPSRTGANMTAQTTLRLAHSSDKFIAVKEASGNLQQCMEIVQNKPKDFLVLSGDDLITLPMLAFGIDGVISVVANAFPRQFSEMVRFGLANDFVNARPLHFDLMDIIDLIFVDGNPAGIKGVLEMLGICNKEVRLPLAELTLSTESKLKAAIQQLLAVPV